MKKPANPIKPEDVKLGSDDMLFWKKIIDGQEIEVADIKKSLKFSTWLIEKAKEEFDKAEAEFQNI